MTINHGGLSGGKDSTALMLWMKYESGYPEETLRFSFCDTGNELEATYEYVRMLGEKVHPIEWLKPERDFYELARKKGRFPSARARFCTQELKMKPSRDYAFALIEEGHEVLLHTGVRSSESEARSLLKERDVDTWYGLPVYRPLLSWTIDDVWAIHKRHGIPRNPLYAMGMKRVGCAPCIMSQKNEIRRLHKLFPERFDMIREQERQAEERGRVSTFFAADKVPECQRSREVAAKDGTLYKLTMIDDVVRWSQTSRGGAQYTFDLDDDEAQACWHWSGLCE
jgi:3'-phosphoadenosine 5'-phosphosulfate sulfotransferase (PAPS reductase)/FAD synthetase